MSERIVSDIGLNLAAARALRHMSAQQLSDILAGQISRGVIANIETGRKNDITVSELIAFSKALDVAPTYLAPELKAILSEETLRRQARSDAFAEAIQMLAERART